MNALAQLDNGLLGSQEAVEALAKAEAARILVLSDTHGHYEVMEEIIRSFGPGCSALCFAGDGMWDIVQYLENSLETDRLRESLPPVLAFVAGNGDGDQYRVGLPDEADLDSRSASGLSLTVPQRQILRACGYGILIAHGHRHSVDVNLDILVDSAHALDCDVAIYGHTHIPLIEEFSHITVLNPGSPARPRGRSEPSFAVLELDSSSTVPKTSFYIISKGFMGTYYFDPSFLA
ncbi:MAG: hypothetical protein BWY39_00610 [Spirochaetes bacterium ADurb.Bin269]|nr:MAG: hypothetical protein BWY39_00610 [Spirochaetes bacterium ADurb.Bin269]